MSKYLVFNLDNGKVIELLGTSDESAIPEEKEYIPNQQYGHRLVERYVTLPETMMQGKTVQMTVWEVCSDKGKSGIIAYYRVPGT